MDGVHRNKAPKAARTWPQVGATHRPVPTKNWPLPTMGVMLEEAGQNKTVALPLPQVGVTHRPLPMKSLSSGIQTFQH
jgi:hypothetical protein